MIATQIAITACLGCVPIDDGAMHSERSTWSDAETHLQLTHTPKAADYGAVGLPKPDLTVNRLSPAEWAASDAMAGIIVKAESSPMPVRFQDAEIFSAGMVFTAPSADTGLGLDMSVAPRATIEKRGQFKTARAGAEVRLGQGLEDMVDSFDERGSYSKIDSWYVFAATDGEALCWDLGDKGAKLDGVALRDQVTVGDIQAGVAFQKAGGALSFGYVHREYSHEGARAKEDFAAVSFTMKR